MNYMMLQKKAGMSGGKISGAGGGGFMMMYCPQNSRYKVMEAIRQFNGRFLPFQFSKKGVRSWKIYE